MDNLRSSVVLVLLMPLLAANTTSGQSGSAGNTGLAFLKLGVGGRAAAMGEAFTSVTDEATATYWNPAGLSFISNSQVAFTHTEWIQDVSLEFLAFAFPAFGGGIGLSFYSNNVGGIERRVNPSAEPLGIVEAHDIAFGLSYGHAFSRTLRGGISMKYLFEKISTESVSGFAFDFGANYQPFDQPIKLAVVIQNLGSVNNLREQSIDLPTTARAGLSYQHDFESLDGLLLLAVDAVKVFESDLRGNFGAELQFKKRMAFRAGYQTGFDDKSFAGGFGLLFDRYRLDYGYTPFNSGFGDSHKFSFGLQL